MRTVKIELANKIASTLQETPENCAMLMEYPPNPELGDLALPCFKFAKKLRKNPQQIAHDIAQLLKSATCLESVTVENGYVNMKIRHSVIWNKVFEISSTHIANLFTRQRFLGKRVAIDYSSPNIAKPFGVGHLRSTIIGEALLRMLKEDGFEGIGINHLGDWGTQFGKVIAAYQKWGSEDKVKENPIRELFQLYVRFHQEAEQNPHLEEEARYCFKKLEDGDEETIRLWQWFIKESLTGFEKTYRLLGVHFDHYLGESFYNDKMEAVVEELQDKHLLAESDGAFVVDLSEWNMPPCIIRKSDGTTIYATRDLAAALYRHDKLHADYLLYVVGSEQTLHFQQVFKVLDLMGRDWSSNCVHVAFGLMKFNGEKLSTRRGHVVYLEDVLEKAIQEARSIIESKNPNLSNPDEVARQVGVGAVIFNDLKTYRIHDVDFRYEDVLNFDGETGPYVQYTHARACSVLRKALTTISQEETNSSVSVPDVPLQSFTLTPSEWSLLKQIAQANEFFERAVDQYDPSVIARFALLVSHAFNRFYHDDPILTAPHSIRQRRLDLVRLTKNVLAHTLHLLAIEAPEAM